MKKNPLISIIVPVYNVEKYIVRCVNSILKQTFIDFELILINDGSSDNSLKIIKKIEKNDERIKVYTQKNKGPAITRNLGIKKANGKYLMFIDSDDYIDDNYVEKYYNSITEDDYDIVIGGYKKVSEDKILYTRKLSTGEFAKYVITAPYCHMYKKDFIKKNDIEFLDTSMSEDVFFSLMAYGKTNKIKIIDSIDYNYYTNIDSISNTSHKGFNEKIDFFSFLDKIYAIESSNELLKNYFFIRYVIWYLLYSGKNSYPIKFRQFYKKSFMWLEKNIKEYKNNKYISFLGPKGENPKIGFLVYIFMWLHRLNLVNLFSIIYCKGENNE